MTGPGPVTVVSSSPTWSQMTMRATGREDQPLALVFTNQHTGGELVIPLTREHIWWLHEVTRPAPAPGPQAGAGGDTP